MFRHVAAAVLICERSVLAVVAVVFCDVAGTADVEKAAGSVPSPVVVVAVSVPSVAAVAFRTEADVFLSPALDGCDV